MALKYFNIIWCLVDATICYNYIDWLKNTNIIRCRRHCLLWLSFLFWSSMDNLCLLWRNLVKPLKSIPKQTQQTTVAQKKLQLIQREILLKLPKAEYSLLTLTHLLTTPMVLSMENTILRNVAGKGDPERLGWELETGVSLRKSGKTVLSNDQALSISMMLLHLYVVRTFHDCKRHSRTLQKIYTRKYQ